MRDKDPSPPLTTKPGQASETAPAGAVAPSSLRLQLRKASYAEGVVMLKPSEQATDDGADGGSGDDNAGADAVIDAFEREGAAGAAQALLEVPESALGAVLDHLVAAKLGLVDAAIQQVPDDEAGVGVVIAAIQARYGVAEITGDWDVPTLQRVWTTLALVPPEDVDSTINTAFQTLHGTVDTDETTEGGYTSSTGGVEIEYDPDSVANTKNEGYEPDDPMMAGTTRGNVDDGDALDGVNRFDKVLLHEIGHAVDDKLGYMDAHQAEDACGAWETFGNPFAVAMRLSDASDYPYAAITELFRADSALAAYQEAVDAAATDDDEGYQTFLVDPSVQAALAMRDYGAFYYRGPDVAKGLAVEGRVYQGSYDSYFTSYNASARDHQVSNYQFRAPGEWFAELYAAFYLGTLPESHPYYATFVTDIHERGLRPESEAP